MPVGPFTRLGILALGVGGARDVEMGPREAVHELAQEPARRDAARRAAAAVLHVGDVRLVELAVLVPERQRPDALAGALARRAHLLDQRARRCP